MSVTSPEVRAKRVLVCGGRDYDRSAILYAALDGLLRRHRSLVIIEGGAKGADRLAASWTRNHNNGVVEHVVFSADWERYGKRAGMIRNQQMLDEGAPDIVLVFPGGRGTADMERRAREAGLDTRVMDQPCALR